MKTPSPAVPSPATQHQAHLAGAAESDRSGVRPSPGALRWHGQDALRNAHRQRAAQLMDGCTLAAQLRQSRPGHKVLFSSGYAREAVMAQAARPSSDGFLPKPYHAAALVHTICEVLGHRPPPAA